MQTMGQLPFDFVVFFPDLLLAPTPLMALPSPRQRRIGDLWTWIARLFVTPPVRSQVPQRPSLPSSPPPISGIFFPPPRTPALCQSLTLSLQTCDGAPNSPTTLPLSDSFLPTLCCDHVPAPHVPPQFGQQVPRKKFSRNPTVSPSSAFP